MAVWSNDYIKLNKYSRPGSKLTARRKGVLHYTANPGATARNHVTYFGKTLIEMNERLPVNQRRYASAHIFVDKNEAICIIPLNEVAYAANDGSYRGVPALKPNANFLSVSVEMCQEKDGSFHPDTIARTENVFVELSKMYGWNPLNDIVRHYDITHKNCPAPWVSNGQKFIDFKKRVNEKLKGKKPSVTSKPASPGKKPASKPSGAYTGGSIVDYLNSIGVDSSKANRKKLAKQYGVSGYDYSADKNLELLNKMKTGKPVSKPAAKPKPQPKGTVHLPASAKTWRTYKLNIQPIKKNSDWSLTPAAFGGLTYEILGRPYHNVVTINTSRGKRNIYVGPETGAVIK